MLCELDVELYTNNDSHCMRATYPSHDAMQCVCQPQHHLARTAVEDDDDDGYDFLCRSYLLDDTTYDRCLLGSKVATWVGSMMRSYVISLHLAEVTLRRKRHGEGMVSESCY